MAKALSAGAQGEMLSLDDTAIGAFRRAWIADGRLERVLEPFIPPTSGLFLYFAARTQSQPKLRAFIDMATAAQAL